MQLYSISAIADVYADAYMTDDSGSLLFLSVWGRDTALQEFLARLQLPRSENGIREFSVQAGTAKRLVRMPSVDDLDKMTAKTSSTIFGDLCQLWIYHQMAVTPDMVNHRALMLYDPDAGVPDLWQLFKTVCPLPMLDDWKSVMLDQCTQLQWIKPIAGVGISGYQIELTDELEPLVTRMIRQGALTLPDESDESIADRIQPTSIQDLFGDVIHSYTRKDALEDGYLVDVTDTAVEAGFRWPVAMTREAWEDCVAWDDIDSHRQVHQDESGRLWDVLYMAHVAIQQASQTGAILHYQIHRVPRGGRESRARQTTLKLVTGPGDHGEPVVTIMLPHED